MKYSIQAFRDSTKSEMLADWSSVAEQVRVRTSRRGIDRASMFVPMGLEQSFKFYSQGQLAHLVINYESEKWAGRIEDPAIVPGGISISAFGYWRGLRDTLYTALWSDTSTRRWETVISNSVFTPERYQIDFNNRLYIAARGGEQISSNQRGVVGYRIPDKSSRDIVEVEFTYEFLAPSATWQMLFNRGNSEFAGGVNEITVNGTGSLITATVTQTLGAAAASVLFAVKYNSVTPTTVTSTGDVYLKITGIRVKTKTGTIYADDIIADMIAPISTTQLAQSTALIQSPGVDIQDAIFEDERPADVLGDMETWGDSNTPPRVWAPSVDKNQMLTFAPVGDNTDNHLYIDVAAIDLQSTVDNLRTSVYAKYQSEDGRTLRTSTSTNAASVLKYGVDRVGTVRVSTTSPTQAESLRDADLDEKGEIQPRSGIITNKLYNASGGSVPLIEAAGGSLITIRNLPQVGAELNNVETFTIDSTDFMISDGEVELVPSRDLPGIAALLATALG